MVPLPMPLVPLPVPPVPAVQSTGAVIKLTTKNPVMISLTLRITYPSVSCTCLFMFLREDLHAYPLNARGNPLQRDRWRHSSEQYLYHVE